MDYWDSGDCSWTSLSVRCCGVQWNLRSRLCQISLVSCESFHHPDPDTWNSRSTSSWNDGQLATTMGNPTKLSRRYSSIFFPPSYVILGVPEVWYSQTSHSLFSPDTFIWELLPSPHSIYYFNLQKCFFLSPLFPYFPIVTSILTYVLPCPPFPGNSGRSICHHLWWKYPSGEDYVL